MKALHYIIFRICHFGRATREFIITICISFLPVFMGAGLSCLWGGTNFYQALLSNFKTGEAFLYSSAFLVPYVHKKILEAKSSLFSIFVFVFSLYSFFVGAFIFSFVRLEGIMSKKMNMTGDYISLIGWSIIISTIIVWYYSVWQEHSKPENISKINNDKQKDYSEELKKRIGGIEK